MFLQPNKTKYKKTRKGKIRKFNHKNSRLIFGTVGLKSTESGLISSRQLESARQAINRKLKRKGKIWIRIFPVNPVTSKPNESRMGKGKGNLSYWCAKVSSGTIVFEICHRNIKDSIVALYSGKSKLPLKTKIITI